MRVGDVLDEFKELPDLSEEFPVLTLTEHNGFVYQSDRFNKRMATTDISKYKVIRFNDIAFNPYLLWAGAIAQNTITRQGVISPLYPTFRVRAKNDPRYVARLLLSPRMVRAYDHIAFGSIPRRRRSSVSDFLNLPIPPMPALEEQKRIAEILDRADAVRVKRERQLAKLAQLIQATFQQMFGDDYTTSNKVAFGDVADLRAGRNLVAPDMSASTPFRVLKISAVTSGIYRPEESKPLPYDYVPPEDHLIQEGDLLMSRANTARLVGATAYVGSSPENIALPDKVWKFRWRRKNEEPLFYQALLSTPSVRHQISQLASGTGGSMKNISKAKLSRLLLPDIEPARQRSFVTVANTIAKIRNKIQETGRADNELFVSLQSRAFQGEL